MSLRVEVDRPHMIPGSYRTVVVTTEPEPEPGKDFSTESFSVTLVGVSKTRVINGNVPGQEIHESSVTLQRIVRWTRVAGGRGHHTIPIPIPPRSHAWPRHGLDWQSSYS